MIAIVEKVPMSWNEIMPDKEYRFSLGPLRTCSVWSLVQPIRMDFPEITYVSLNERLEEDEIIRRKGSVYRINVCRIARLSSHPLEVDPCLSPSVCSMSTTFLLIVVYRNPAPWCPLTLTPTCAPIPQVHCPTESKRKRVAADGKPGRVAARVQKLLL